VHKKFNEKGQKMLPIIYVDYKLFKRYNGINLSRFTGKDFSFIRNSELWKN
jgi:hypothetical protein